MIKVIVAGYQGRMGSTAAQMVIDNPDFELVGVYDARGTDQNLNENNQFSDQDVPAFHDLKQLTTDATVWIDFTVPTAVYENAQFALKHGISPVIGTTGMTDEQVAALQKLAKVQQVGGLIAPNFGISAVLLMQFAQQAAKYFPDVEIIEMHHDDKIDSPSGTAISTAKKIAEVRQPKEQGNPDATETLPGARGADYEGMRIHAVRLPGLVAHEEVMFGGPGEGLTIRQDSFDRISFMTGVKVAVEKVNQYQELFVGLEHLL
ncbi:4-hydroxy-tetrahydrodipicolinate reductase [Lactobacillus sp. CBA3605]|uniref:4-hydroxy-tetrahydrodipicolinate reductase n=1 Tax=Lactobacillus sp. CBA3605 TaxID=2099788 RepID=UPI000CFCF686|nr:4-hydroxy-tetrahydrodipicolinate reductase [Lactobacillus sp. CBA3605]AVK60429.1 4-hydroxy-tetrahydrodipicolinate reductase [Lactobacillus sp. CBA3605]